MNKYWTILFCFLLISFSTKAQNGFEGEMVFEISLSGEGASELAPFMPTGYFFKMKGPDLLFKMEGGMMAAMLGEMLIKGDEGVGYLMKHDERYAYRFSLDVQESGVVPTVTETGESETILGYSCKKYRVLTIDESSGEELEAFYWVTQEINLHGAAANSQGAKNLQVMGIKGCVLKTTTNQMGFLITNQLKSIKPQALSASLFKIPSDYTTKEAKELGIPGFE